MCGGVLPCVAVCGSMWQCVAVCGSVLQRVAIVTGCDRVRTGRGSVLHCVAVSFSLWPCVQCVTVFACVIFAHFLSRRMCVYVYPHVYICICI